MDPRKVNNIEKGKVQKDLFSAPLIKYVGKQLSMHFFVSGYEHIFIKYFFDNLFNNKRILMSVFIVFFY